MSASGITGVAGLSLTSQTAQSIHNRQNLPGGTATGFSTNLAAAMAAHSSNNMPQAQLKTYFNETPAQRMQDDWLSQHGITKAQFNAMNGPDKQKIVDEMKQDIEAKMKQRLGSSTGSSALSSSTASTGAASSVAE